MEYDKEILRVLTEAGSGGISVRKISRHVFNACNSLFDPITQEEVHKYVQWFLLKNSRATGSVVVRKKKGIYRLDLSNKMTQQLILQFHCEEKNLEEKTAVDHSLSLF